MHLIMFTYAIAGTLKFKSIDQLIKLFSDFRRFFQGG